MQESNVTFDDLGINSFKNAKMYKLRKMFLSFQGDASSRDELSCRAQNEEVARAHNEETARAHLEESARVVKRQVVSVLSDGSRIGGAGGVAGERPADEVLKQPEIGSGRRHVEFREDDATRRAPRKIRIGEEASSLSQQVKAELGRLTLQLNQ